jgi:hypothetical protein
MSLGSLGSGEANNKARQRPLAERVAGLAFLTVIGFPACTVHRGYHSRRRRGIPLRRSAHETGIAGTHQKRFQGRNEARLIPSPDNTPRHSSGNILAGVRGAAMSPPRGPLPTWVANPAAGCIIDYPLGSIVPGGPSSQNPNFTGYTTSAPTWQVARNWTYGGGAGRPFAYTTTCSGAAFHTSHINEAESGHPSNSGVSSVYQTLQADLWGTTSVGLGDDKLLHKYCEYGAMTRGWITHTPGNPTNCPAGVCEITDEVLRSSGESPIGGNGAAGGGDCGCSGGTGAEAAGGASADANGNGGGAEGCMGMF